jgi:two-component system osmolarity sensor histidine kinase EnvZ
MAQAQVPSRSTASWAPGGVFWRTFLLIAVLIAASIVGSYQSFRVLERRPRAEQAAELIVSVVNLTRSALIHSDPEKRRALLIDLAQNEGVRIYPLEATDDIATLPRDVFLGHIVESVQKRLGSDTRISLQVNGQPGLWVSFFIDDDGYWVAFDSSRLDNLPRIQWLGWALGTLALSLLGAVVISRLVNMPLKRLADAAVAIGRGARPAPLPEAGPNEIRAANRSFNVMVADLERIEADRALLLAGISHDLRTPLTRLRLEVEINQLDDATRQAMSADVDQMDAIIGQFLDYARPMNQRSTLSSIKLQDLVTEIIEQLAPGQDLIVTTHLGDARPVAGHAMDLKRVIFNLIENARRYGKTPGTDQAEIDVSVGGGETPWLSVSDHGPGVAGDDLERLKRPFTRLDEARSQASGAGLGLAIVERIARRHGARFELRSERGKGLAARLIFHDQHI